MFGHRRIGRSWIVRSYIGYHRFLFRRDLLPEEESKLVSTMTAAAALKGARTRMENSIVFDLMHRELRCGRPGHLGLASRRRYVFPELLDAVQCGEIVAYEDKPAPPPQLYIEIEPPVPETPGPEIKTWIGVTLIDAKGRPVPDHTYRLEKPDGGVVEGELDSRSSVVVTGLESGQCQVSFDCQASAGASSDLGKIDVVLVDGADSPLANVAYQLKMPGGRVVSGKTDGEGKCRVPEIPPGSCQFTLTGVDGGLWALSS
jgi:hypothetical protein